MIQLMTLTPDLKQSVINALADIRESCAGLELTGCLEKAARAISETERNYDNYPEAVKALAKDLFAEIECALKQRVFLYVRGDRLGYIDNERLFGDAVYEAFPSSRFEIAQAGNCLATECSTAAVFHLMRAAEYGLRALAWDRRIEFPSELDLATWEDLIRGLEKAETAIQGFKKTSAREAQYNFYHGAMMEVKRFKNKFRNQVMHTRVEYDRDEAHSAFVHVRDFMRILASRISEQKRTPIVWKGKRWTTTEP